MGTYLYLQQIHFSNVVGDPLEQFYIAFTLHPIAVQLFPKQSAMQTCLKSCYSELLPPHDAMNDPFAESHFEYEVRRCPLATSVINRGGWDTDKYPILFLFQWNLQSCGRKAGLNSLVNDILNCFAQTCQNCLEFDFSLILLFHSIALPPSAE